MAFLKTDFYFKKCNHPKRMYVLPFSNVCQLLDRIKAEEDEISAIFYDIDVDVAGWGCRGGAEQDQ